MRDVLFIRTPVTRSQDVTVILKNLVRAGWRVVSHTESDEEYTFVLEGAEGTLV
jgi:hypothetical protein